MLDFNILNKLKKHIPDSVITQIPDAAIQFNITTTLRLAHFLSQCAHESGNFNTVEENLNYSARGLLNTFPSHFTTAEASVYARQPAKIGARVYASRNGNGVEATGDGYRYRGRGFIQLTGKANYANFTKFIGVDVVTSPDLVAIKFPLASAAFFFDSNKIWAVCDKGSTEDIVTRVTSKVNGGTIGLDERIKYFKLYIALLS